ncbi:hypothetical protein ADIAG_01266 [Paeniglutamicibacter gangotriensis Lz1y]|uniref:Uncharacterized protein n=1 Tax=Paeniglutamicibacter gangotriensis Lz1y TaxID=1276920 RepID=M7NL83_9MICC|nr:hypothetical protein ADIAG_01266 [Paeniglutamicibacter gangotriensis Lz1y]
MPKAGSAGESLCAGAFPRLSHVFLTQGLVFTRGTPPRRRVAVQQAGAFS